MRFIDEKTFVFCATRLGEECSVLEELISTNSVLVLAAVSSNL